MGYSTVITLAVTRNVFGNIKDQHFHEIISNVPNNLYK